MTEPVPQVVHGVHAGQPCCTTTCTQPTVQAALRCCACAARQVVRLMRMLVQLCQTLDKVPEEVRPPCKTGNTHCFLVGSPAPALGTCTKQAAKWLRLALAAPSHASCQCLPAPLLACLPQSLTPAALPVHEADLPRPYPPGVRAALLPRRQGGGHGLLRQAALLHVSAAAALTRPSTHMLVCTRVHQGASKVALLQTVSAADKVAGMTGTPAHPPQLHAHGLIG